MTTSNAPRRRRSRGSAWHWRQTDGWYFTPPGTKRRVRLLDEDGRPIRGKENRQAAELAFARVKASGNWRPEAEKVGEDLWLVAKVCSQYIEHCEQRAAKGRLSAEYRDEVVRYLNDLCSYCGSLPISELRKGHVQHWVESHATWQSPTARATRLSRTRVGRDHRRQLNKS
ncbi:MAG: hypothetical protein QGG09_09925, partial [Pirellulaceae bacterium]|nr:hypothetical protein [Pirellulaceae bacterium]